jgi:CheY-like chemotaxis protein/anti-sigma regulatory factor (Ser/Thr protein kinase)
LSFGPHIDQRLPPWILGDERRIRQILINLLSNAIKSTVRGEVCVWAELVPHSPNQLRFKVTDTGSGIPLNHLDAIFEPFYQAHIASRREEGTGLGLSICKRLVSDMGSQLHVTSTVGEGSTFWFDLNLETPHPSSHQQPLATIPAIQAQGQSILIIDDESNNRNIIKSLLAPYNFQLWEAEDGQQGLAKALELQPDVILLDMLMPNLDGYSFLRELQRHPIAKQCKVVAVSASVFDQNQTQALQSGCDAFLSKPVRLANLIEILRTLLLLPVHHEQRHDSEQHTNFDQAPDAHTLLILQDLISNGRFTDIKRSLHELREQPGLSAFATRIEEYVDSFELDDAMLYLSELLPVSPKM